MIIEKVCFCGSVLSANGHFKFDDLVRKHFMYSHPEIWSKIKRQIEDADSELSSLKEKYLELIEYFGSFQPNFDVLLKGDSNG